MKLENRQTSTFLRYSMKSFFVAVFGFYLCLGGIFEDRLLWAQSPVDHVLNIQKTTVVPETYLRGYDPITVFFKADSQPRLGKGKVLEGGEPLDDPTGIISLHPDHPGEYRWLDDTTLQFIPTIPWPALERYTVRVANLDHSLVTLMTTPNRIQPSPGSKNLEPFQEMTLSFDHRLGADELSQMLSFEVKPLPGVGEEKRYWLTQRDFTIKQVERTLPSAPVQYQLTFSSPIPYGKKVTMHLHLSLSAQVTGSVAQYSFSTKPLFRLTGMGCGSTVYPVAVQGSIYSVEQAINCGDQRAELFLQFSDQLGAVSLAAVKRMVRFEPAVQNFEFSTSNKRIHLKFDAQRDKPYRMQVMDEPLLDQAGRTLASFEKAELFFYRPQSNPYLKWLLSQGLVERYGPQQFPMEGRGDEQLDIRIFKIDSQDRNFWPYPTHPVLVDESQRPPGPGEEPAFTKNLAQHIQLLGSPLVSRMVPLPMKSNSYRLKFGLDLKPFFAQISGVGQPGTYLVGYRRVGSTTKRQFVRVQVTDLNLSTVEEESGILFVVTSLRTGHPISDAQVIVEGTSPHASGRDWVPLIEGRTNAEGVFHYEHQTDIEGDVTRITVRSGNDVLTLDPERPPPKFIDNHWYTSRTRWLQWLREAPRRKREEISHKVHLFTERPIYRPEEPVHIKGYLRLRQQGELSLARHRDRELEVEGPGGKSWTYPIDLTEAGSFYVKFDEEDLPTGSYQAYVYDYYHDQQLGSVTFKKESYRIPRFEINLHGPSKVPLDRPFSLSMVADYYAGGRVIDQDVTWRVTQFPYRFQPPAFPGYLFSTDSRFSDQKPFRSSGTHTQREKTDEQGSSELTLNPATEVDGRPRRYVVEVTVRGADEQTVSTTKQVLALPPFVLGIQLERFLTDSKIIQPQLLVLDHRGKPLAGKTFQLRLFHRQWHSYLKESDFTTGATKYVNEVVDKPIFETTLTSTQQALLPKLPVEEAGVYVVEILARDELGRLQKVSADLYVSGETPVTWKKPKTRVFSTVLDKVRYNAGEEAQLLLQSPFQTAEAFVVVEGPKRNRYHWVEIKNGQGIFTLPISGDMTPRVAVHTLLMRGRVPSKSTSLIRSEDRAKPVAMANTTWVRVNPSDHQMTVAVEHLPKVLPGDTLQMKVKLFDLNGAPLDGEVTLWLVDRAVLALGKEQRLDPIPSFIDPVNSRLRFLDMRNETLGEFPLEEFAGGDGSGKKQNLFENVTVRRNFKTVPYYNPTLAVVDGEAEVEIPMPDNLTEFAVRAVATDGLARFGVTKSTVQVRLPVIVQSALPRFVRPGDRFVAGGIGRIVEGDGGPGIVELQVEGLDVETQKTQSITWVPDRAETIYFPMTVVQEAAPQGPENTVTIRLAVQRLTDESADAFEIKLPVKKDRSRIRQERFALLSAEEALEFPVPEEPMRPGTVEQTALLTYEPALVKMLAGLEYLAEYPHGCTEQRISRVIPELALKGLFDHIGIERRTQELEQPLQETMQYLESVVQSNGLFGYWPGSQGYVSLTAYVVEFLSLAKEHGHAINEQLLEQGIQALKEALRSDYSHFIDGASYLERAEALRALAYVGEFQEDYARDFSVQARLLDLYSEARILQAVLKHSENQHSMIDNLKQDLWKSVIFKLRDGEEVYEGLQYRTGRWGGLVHSGEIKTLANVAHALFLSEPQNERVRLLVDQLVNLGEGEGWGSTNANASALLALGAILKQPRLPQQGHQFQFDFGHHQDTMDTTGKAVSRMTVNQANPGKITMLSGDPQAPPLAWLTLSYLPSRSGDTVTQKNEGFVVEREILVIPEDNAPPVKQPVQPRETITLPMGGIVEEHIRVINPESRNFVAIRAPFAAGFEPLNPNLATAPKAAQPQGTFSLKPDYSLYEDDQVTFYYDTLPKGTYDFYFRLRANFEGQFVHPAAIAEMMYRQAVRGRSNGTQIQIEARP